MTISAPVLFSRLSSKARLRHLQLISHIGELGSLQRAAEAVHMSQPAATKALAELEQLLGVPLFERHARGMRPTAVGTALLPLVRRTMRSLQDCAELVAAMGTGVTTTLRIGAVGGGVSGLLCQAVPAFSLTHPRVVVNVAQWGPEELVSAGVQRALDLAICRMPERMPQGFSFIPLAEDRYVVVCSPRHRLAGRKKVRITDLARETWMIPEQIGVSGRGFQRLWDQMGSGVDTCWVTSRSPLLLWAMLEERQVLRYVPYTTVRHLLDAGVVATLPGPWESPLPPLGALARSAELEGDTPLAALVAELKRHGALLTGAPG